ncbi:MAG TPA: TldD/PmbA family protein [Bryobacteraceae bacterium]|nr:TldD/PmbA family protein [Bryobacteraceae bacterium]
MTSQLLTPEQCRSIFDVVQRAARVAGVSDVELHVGAKAEALTRFANNTIHQNVAEQTRFLSVRAMIGQRMARASTNRLDNESIRGVVEQAIAIAKASEEDPDLLPMAEPATLKPVARFFTSTAHATPGQRAAAVAEAIKLAEAASMTAAGIYSTEQSVEAVYNSRGVAAYHTETLARCSITAMAEDSSGWAKASSTDRTSFSAPELARQAVEKARLSRNPRELEPGRYTVILEPAAVLDVVGQMFGDFSATSIADQRSFLTNRIGEALFGSNIEIHDDVFHGSQAGPAFDGEGVPRKRLKLVDAGTPHEVAYARSSAAKAGVEATGHGFPLPNEIGEMPVNIVISGGDTSVDQMVASTRRGILVTRLWYIREVDPYEKIMTGMTRDGTFLIENGEIAGGIRNFRFNQSIIEMLRNVEALSPSLRTSGEEAFDMVVPAMKVADFNFTEVTRF